MTKHTRLLSLTAAILLAGISLLWLTRTQPSERSRERQRVVSGIVTTPTHSHRPQPSLAPDGTARPLPADPALADALSSTSRLDYALRLKAVHALDGSTLTAIDADFLRAFIAHPAIPEGLTIQQLRALKNDVLNVLCLQPGGEATTAALLRTLHADKTQDSALRDYALQHLVTLSERDSSLGWSAHWAAIDGADPTLAATAMIHLVAQLRPQSSAPAAVSPPSDLPATHSPLLATERARLARAALRLAADPKAPAPARTTALQLCGQLQLTDARPLAAELARSADASFPLRIAAVATLGDLGGDTATRDYLTALVTGPERRLRIPAESALKRFSLN